MDFWRILTMITAAGVLWLVYQRRREMAPKPVVSTTPAVQTTEQLVAAILAAE